MSRLPRSATDPARHRPAVPARPTRPKRAVAAMLALAAALGAGALPAAAQDGIGRLFFTPAQRQQLDEARRRPTAPEPVRDASEAPKPPPARSISVDGIVRRGDGQATVWVNRAPTQAPQTTGAVRIGPVRDAGDGADLRLTESGRRVRIKVGQEVDVQSGQIQERYRQPAPAPAAPATPAPSTNAATGAPANPATIPPAAMPAKAQPEDAVAPSAGAATRNETPRDAAVERILRELGRRLDDTPRAPSEAAR
jgi:hypothetical protein